MKRAAEATPDAGPSNYCAKSYHEIAVPGGGVMRVEPGYFVVADGDKVEVMPPEAFAAKYGKS